ncbi:MAG: MgtC/SapB family protein [Gemmatimonas sp.]
MNAFLNIFRDELTSGLPNPEELAHAIIRLTASALLGAVVGIQREKAGKPAGLRTHMLVSLGTTVFILAGTSVEMSPDSLSRVIQGIVTGLGFIGAGAIIKIDHERNIQGLTSAAGIWMTAAIGACVGVGSLGVALLSTLATLGVLALARPFEMRGQKSPIIAAPFNDDSPERKIVSSSTSESSDT